MSTFFAWATPAFVSGSPVDHTWVTTYDNRRDAYADIQKVISANQTYWYSWGDFHKNGGTPSVPDGYLGSQNGDLTLANCIVLGNADSRQVAAARGTIFDYGVDGVCHQLSNQVLYATKGAQKAPLTVRNARGYFASNFVYGTYGIQHAAWGNKIVSCGQAVVSAVTERGLSVTDLPDDFEAHARAVLESQDPKLLNELLALRAQVQRFSLEEWPGATPSAETLNARNQHMFDQAAKLLGREKFIQVFGFSPDERINLIDPSIRPPSQ